jgi:serine/threonine-protein kinase
MSEQWPPEERPASEAETRVIRKAEPPGPPEPPESGPPPPPWWREYWWIWLAVLGVLVVGVIVLLLVLQDGDDEEATSTTPTVSVVTVPDVVGLSEAVAVQRLSEAGLRAQVGRETSEDVPLGSVIEQDPAAGSDVTRLRVVELTVSSGPPEVETVTETVTETETQPPPEPPDPETVQMPDVVGLSHEEAAASVEDLGLVADTYPVPSAEPFGVVVAVAPAAGTEVREGQSVRLNVSLGPDERTSVTVPDLTGLEASDARRRCREAGLTCRTLYRTAPSEEEQGEVLDQQPAAGETVLQLTQITLFVGR